MEHAKQGVEMRSKQRKVLMSKMEQVDQSSADDGADVRIVEEDSCCTNKMSQKRKLSLEVKTLW